MPRRTVFPDLRLERHVQKKSQTIIRQRCEPKVPSGIQAHGISGSYTHLQGNAEEFSENQRRPDPNIRTDEVALQKVGVDIAVWVLFEGESAKSMCLRHSNRDCRRTVLGSQQREETFHFSLA